MKTGTILCEQCRKLVARRVKVGNTFHYYCYSCRGNESAKSYVMPTKVRIQRLRNRNLRIANRG